METIVKRRMKITVKHLVTPASEKVRLKKKRPLLHIRGKELWLCYKLSELIIFIFPCSVIIFFYI